MVVVHELGLLSGVVRKIVEVRPDAKVDTVALRVGARSGVVVESLHAAWPIARQQAPEQCADAELTIEFIPATVYCPACACEHEIDEFFALVCPVCGAPTADLRHGREFEIAYLDVSST